MVHHWDFFGPESSKTAEHFKKHVFEFIRAHQLESYASGLFNAHTNHTCFWIEFEDGSGDHETQKKLRPQRSLSRSEHERILAELASAPS